MGRRARRGCPPGARALVSAVLPGKAHPVPRRPRPALTPSRLTDEDLAALASAAGRGVATIEDDARAAAPRRQEHSRPPRAAAGRPADGSGCCRLARLARRRAGDPRRLRRARHRRRPLRRRHKRGGRRRPGVRRARARDRARPRADRGPARPRRHLAARDVRRGHDRPSGRGDAHSRAVSPWVISRRASATPRSAASPPPARAARPRAATGDSTTSSTRFASPLRQANSTSDARRRAPPDPTSGSSSSGPRAPSA